MPDGLMINEPTGRPKCAWRALELHLFALVLLLPASESRAAQDPVRASPTVGASQAAMREPAPPKPAPPEPASSQPASPEEVTAEDAAAVSPSGSPSPSSPGMRGAPAREQFLQHALGTQGDVRVPAVLLSLAAVLAVFVVAWKRMRRRGLAALDEVDDLPEIEGRDDLEPERIAGPSASPPQAKNSGGED